MVLTSMSIMEMGKMEDMCSMLADTQKFKEANPARLLLLLPRQGGEMLFYKVIQNMNLNQLL